MGVDDPVDALQLDQALHLRLVADQLERKRARQAASGAKGTLAPGLRHESLGDLPPDPGAPR